jgi:hypothetical protein
MDTGLVHLHNLLRWVILILLVWSLFRAYTGWKSGSVFQQGDRKIWLITMIVSHLTGLLGIYQVLWGRIGWFKHPALAEGETVMSNKGLRFFLVEHPILMLLAIVFITMGYRLSKKPFTDKMKYTKATIYFLIALVAILVAIPWPFRAEVGRAWFPGM